MKLPNDVPDVLLDGIFSYQQLRANLFVRITLDKEVEDLDLSLGQGANFWVIGPGGRFSGQEQLVSFAIDRALPDASLDQGATGSCRLYRAMKELAGYVSW